MFNRDGYTFPSHWTWLKGWLEFVNTQLLPLGRRPVSPGPPALCQIHTQSRARTRTCWLDLTLGFAQVRTGKVTPCPLGMCVCPLSRPRAPQGHSMRSPTILCNRVCMFMCIGLLAHNSMHACFERTNPLSFRYEPGCELPVVYTDTHTHLTGVCARSHTRTQIWVHMLFSGKFYIKAFIDRYTHNYTNPPARISKAKCSTTCTTNINTKVANSYTHTWPGPRAGPCVVHILRDTHRDPGPRREHSPDHGLLPS